MIVLNEIQREGNMVMRKERDLGMKGYKEPQLRSYDEVEEGMQTYIDEAFLTQPFFQTLLSGQWDRRMLTYFSQQYAHYSANFPRVLGAAIAVMEPEDRWWIPLADNLWDEAGRGRPGHSHASLYLNFVHSVDPSSSQWHPHPNQWPKMGPSVEVAIKSFIDFLVGSSPLDAMAAIALGSEFFAGQVMGIIAEGLRHPRYQEGGAINTTFWDLHAAHDEPRHYALCRAILCEKSKKEHYGRLLDIGKEIAASESMMYAGIYQEAQELS